MKKQIFVFIFVLGISIGINAGGIYAQSTEVVRVEVPFAFSANNRTLPAGTYVVDPADSNRRMWKIQGRYQKADSAFLLAGSLSGSEGAGSVRLIFHRYGSENFLIGFKTFSYQVELPTSRSEKGVRGSAADIAKYEVVSLEPLAKK